MSRIRAVVIYAVIWLIGGALYCVLELMYRGRTHQTMFIAGGLCVLILYMIAAKSGVPVWKKWIIAGAAITTVEFLTGAAVNLILGLKVWDYSNQKLHLMGQICLSFSVLWLVISIPVIWVLRQVEKRVIIPLMVEGDI